MTEVVEVNVTGLVVNVGEVEKLSRALLAFQADEASRHRLGEMARTRARLYFFFKCHDRRNSETCILSCCRNEWNIVTSYELKVRVGLRTCGSENS